MRKLIVVPYDPQWSELFQQEADKLTDILGQELIAIHHVGSTSIPGMRAKPIIDIMSVVHSLAGVDRQNTQMTQLGYESKGENGIPGRRYFVKRIDDERTHHVHCYEPNHPEVRKHLAFRDYLIAHPEKATQYADLKMTLLQKFPDGRGYQSGKNGFIEEILRKALA